MCSGYVVCIQVDTSVVVFCVYATVPCIRATCATSASFPNLSHTVTARRGTFMSWSVDANPVTVAWAADPHWSPSDQILAEPQAPEGKLRTAQLASDRRNDAN